MAKIMDPILPIVFILRYWAIILSFLEVQVYIYIYINTHVYRGFLKLNLLGCSGS